MAVRVERGNEVGRAGAGTAAGCVWVGSVSAAAQVGRQAARPVEVVFRGRVTIAVREDVGAVAANPGPESPADLRAAVMAVRVTARSVASVVFIPIPPQVDDVESSDVTASIIRQMAGGQLTAWVKNG